MSAKRSYSTSALWPIILDADGRGTAAINAPGRYLVTAGAEDRPTRIAGHAGAARVTAEGLDQPLKAGEAVALTGTWPPQAQLERAGTPAPIMAWAAALAQSRCSR